ncbi:hypothetical protein Srubr_47770 [Streptomyces rubradiris]|uniref:Uncharacterized protein n=1 Tax=Streptomyces rubradiris TaxID=285531 RepID=A0ABQ3RGE5_STRRR|nr:hypothetical protein GCM10018792_54900 [Streptomyces rubradiris]GHI54931.1 hypothetical protein Srubr_47770 [Streptomyces rubradiris]
MNPHASDAGCSIECVTPPGSPTRPSGVLRGVTASVIERAAQGVRGRRGYFSRQRCGEPGAGAGPGWQVGHQ